VKRSKEGFGRSHHHHLVENLSEASPIQLKEQREKRRTHVYEEEEYIIKKMLQKAKSIKKTLKTEAKAIAYGTERVDKRGKPVTSIADRTNVRFCVILI